MSSEPRELKKILDSIKKMFKLAPFQNQNPGLAPGVTAWKIYKEKSMADETDALNEYGSYNRVDGYYEPSSPLPTEKEMENLRKAISSMPDFPWNPSRDIAHQKPSAENAGRLDMRYLLAGNTTVQAGASITLEPHPKITYDARIVFKNNRGTSFNVDVKKPSDQPPTVSGSISHETQTPQNPNSNKTKKEKKDPN
jgi:hypothetical protein